MFFFITRRLVGNEIIDAVNVIRGKNIPQSSKNKVYKDLRETYNPLFLNILKNVRRVSPHESKSIQNFIETEFFNTLTAPTLKLDDERQFNGYLKQQMNNRVNIGSVREYLGLTPLIKKVWIDEFGKFGAPSFIEYFYVDCLAFNHSCINPTRP